MGIKFTLFAIMTVISISVFSQERRSKSETSQFQMAYIYIYGKSGIHASYTTRDEEKRVLAIKNDQLTHFLWCRDGVDEFLIDDPELIAMLQQIEDDYHKSIKSVRPTKDNNILTSERSKILKSINSKFELSIYQIFQKAKNENRFFKKPTK